MVPWFEFYLPWNVMREPAPLVLLEMACWLGVRLGYLAMYLAGCGALRSLVWAIRVGFVIPILFSGV